MKWSEVPSEVLEMEAVYPPLKLSVDHDALFNMLQKQKYMVIRTDPDEDTPSGNAMIKAFNSHVRTVKNMKLHTKKISTDEWVLTLKGESK